MQSSCVEGSSFPLRSVAQFTLGINSCNETCFIGCQNESFSTVLGPLPLSGGSHAGCRVPSQLWVLEFQHLIYNILSTYLAISKWTVCKTLEAVSSMLSWPVIEPIDVCKWGF